MRNLLTLRCLYELYLDDQKWLFRTSKLPGAGAGLCERSTVGMFRGATIGDAGREFRFIFGVDVDPALGRGAKPAELAPKPNSAPKRANAPPLLPWLPWSEDLAVLLVCWARLECAVSGVCATKWAWAVACLSVVPLVTISSSDGGATTQMACGLAAVFPLFRLLRRPNVGGSDVIVEWVLAVVDDRGREWRNGDGGRVAEVDGGEFGVAEADACLTCCA